MRSDIRDCLARYNQLLFLTTIFNHAITVTTIEVSKIIRNAAIVAALKTAKSLKPLRYSSSVGVGSSLGKGLVDELSGLTSIPALSSVFEFGISSSERLGSF
jgi:hypothetical protein